MKRHHYERDNQVRKNDVKGFPPTPIPFMLHAFGSSVSLVATEEYLPWVYVENSTVLLILEYWVDGRRQKGNIVSAIGEIS